MADWIKHADTEVENYAMEAHQAALEATHAALERDSPSVQVQTIVWELTRLERWFSSKGKLRAAEILAALRNDVTDTLEIGALLERDAMRTHGPHAVDLLSDIGWHGNWHETDRGRLIWTGHAARKAGMPIEDPRAACTQMAALARGDDHENV